MFNNVIVGVDGAEGGRDAIALANGLVAEHGSLIFAYVYRGDSHVWRGSSPAYDAAEGERARELLEQARENAGTQVQLRWRGASSVGRGLHELAEETAADLVVIGSSRRGVFGRVLVGDDTRASLNGAPCAVAIAPAGYSHHPPAMREIGVGYDASPESEYALGVARKLSSELHTKLSAFEAVSIPTYLYVGPAVIDGDTIEDMVNSARKRITAIEGVEPHAAYGLPAEELAVYGASLDLLVIGSRSYGPLGRLVHGSTAQQLARSAHCPLLVLTRGAREAQSSGGSEDGREAAAAGAAST